MGFHTMNKIVCSLLMFVSATYLAGCGGNTYGGSNSTPVAYTVGGNISGLTGTVTLLNNSGNALPVSANGVFTFTNGVLSGNIYSVTVGTQPAGQICTPSSNTGTISGGNVTNVVITCANAYTIGGNITGLNGTITLLNNGGNAKVISADGAFAFTVPMLTGSSYAVTIGTLPGGQTCSLTNGTGTVATVNITNINVACRTMNAYVVNKGSQTISQYSINSSGVLTALSPATVSTASSAPSPVNITIDPTGQYAYVTSDTTNAIAQFSIGSNGALTPLSPAAVTTAALPYSISIDPTGKYAYVSYNSSASVGLFTIGGGALTAGAVASVSPETGPWGISTDPTGKYVYVANHGIDPIYKNTVSQFSIGSGGALSTLTPASAVTGSAGGEAPYYISIDPTGKYAYVSNGNTNTIAQFSINSSTGVLTALSPSSVATGALPFHITTDPKGKFTYVVNYLGGSISQYTIGSSGALTAMTQPTVASGAGSYDIGIDPTGRYAYVTNNSGNSILQYNIGSTTGALTSMATASVPAGSFPTTIAIH